MITKINKTIFECDRCKKQVESDTMPCGAYDPWASIVFKQPTAFDNVGVCWGTRYSQTIHLCGKCANQVSDLIFEFDPESQT